MALRGSETTESFRIKVGLMSNKKEKIVFSSLPETYEQFVSLPQASLSTPFETAHSAAAIVSS